MVIGPHLLGRGSAMESYRHTVFGRDLISMIKFIFGQAGIIAKSLSSLWLILLLISAMICLLNKKHITNKKLYQKTKIFSLIQFICIVLFILDMIIFIQILDKQYDQNSFYVLVKIVLAFTYYFCMTINAGILAYCLRETEIHFFQWIVLSICSILPLLIIDPIADRLLVMPLTFLLIVCVKLTNLYVNTINPKTEKNFFSMISIASFINAICLLIIFSYIHQSYYIRDEYIKEQIKADETTIVLPELRFSNYVYYPREDYTWTFHYGYNEGEVCFKYIPFEQWVQTQDNLIEN